jgi:hypothetical protein
VVFWNCSDSVVFWNCSDSVVFWNCSDSVVFWNCSDTLSEQFQNTTLSEQFQNTTLSEQFQNTTLSEQFQNTTLSEQFQNTTLSEQFQNTTLSEQFPYFYGSVRTKSGKVRGHVYTCVLGSIAFASLCDFSIEFWNCSDSVVLFDHGQLSDLCCLLSKNVDIEFNAHDTFLEYPSSETLL